MKVLREKGEEKHRKKRKQGRGKERKEIERNGKKV